MLILRADIFLGWCVWSHVVASEAMKESKQALVGQSNVIARTENIGGVTSVHVPFKFIFC